MGLEILAKPALVIVEPDQHDTGYVGVSVELWQ